MDHSNVYLEASVNGVVADFGVAGARMVDGMLVPDGAEAQIDNFLDPNQDYNEEEEEQKYFRRKRLAIIKNVISASVGGMLTYGVYLGLLQMQLILHYDETYREVKYGTMGLEDIDNKMLMGINVTPIVALLYTPVLIRFFGTKWMMFLAVGIYALFVSTNYWERYYTLVPSAIAIGVVIVPLWASMGNYITRMAQKYYEYANYKEPHVQEHRKAPRGACHKYIIVFQSIFFIFFHLSFVIAEMPMVFFLHHYLFPLNHTLSNVRDCGTSMIDGILPGFNRTVLLTLPRSLNLIIVESVMMGVAFISMLLILILCGSAYRPTEEIDLRSIGWGNIFQLPFKHMRDYRLRHLFPLFIYSGFEVLFVCKGFALCYGVCSIGLENLAYIIITYGLSASIFSSLSLIMLKVPRQVPLVAGGVIHGFLIIALFCWAPIPRNLAESGTVYLITVLWGLGSALNKSGLSIILGMLYEDKERQDFVFTIYHWWQAMAIFVVYLWSNLPMKAKLSIMLFALLVSIASYLWMERRISQGVAPRIPKIPKPRHKVRGYRYLEDDNSDESDSEKSDMQGSDDSASDEDEQVAEKDNRALRNGAEKGSQRQKRQQQQHNYEQAVEEEEEAGENAGRKEI
ncbi:protein unc-93 homolog B1 [Microcaecilia unicolor]|uniref:Protein unc-93 homolog B1 n=1 Tax=Microcaecilia unicolor TaxID=1415580 RepID=A0A6P7ZGQ4_9AMPH|nr:protein unc-93 homolog B1 [Microcaecilia unicolor]